MNDKALLTFQKEAQEVLAPKEWTVAVEAQSLKQELLAPKEKLLAPKEWTVAVAVEAQSSAISLSAPKRIPKAEEGIEYTVWYGTNRRRADPKASGKGFTAKRDQRVHYGKCVVHVPHCRTFGSLGSSAWKRWLKDKDDRVKLTKIIELPSDAFWNDLQLAIQASNFVSGRRDLLVYLHGFHTSFAQAAVRAAQLGVDLNVPATAFYSWPSRSSLLAYVADGAAIEASENYIEQFLIETARRSEADRVHIVAHSMGNRGLLRSLQGITERAQQKGAVKFGQIFLAAPDVDVETFHRLASLYPQVSERTTLYVSSRDRAVHVSLLLHMSPRVGYAPPITIVDGIDTIEVSAIDFSLIGHGTYAEAEGLLYDMGFLIRNNLPPNARLRIKSVTSDEGKSYWAISK